MSSNLVGVILTANRGALAGDPTVQAIISAQLVTIRNRMLDVMGQGAFTTSGLRGP